VIVVEDDGRSVKTRVPKGKQRGGLGIKYSEDRDYESGEEAKV
jgi:hypothetical protein